MCRHSDFDRSPLVQICCLRPAMKRIELWFFLTISTTLLSPSSSGFAQARSASEATGYAMVHGIVRSEAGGEGLAGVNVYLEETGQGSATDFAGYFRIERVRSEAATLVASRIGYRTYRQLINPVRGDGVRLEIHLSPQPIELDEMLAQAERPFSAASSRTVRDFDLVVRPARTAQDLLQLAPGLITAQHAGGGKAEQIFLRGFDADHGTDVNISVDGLPVNMVSHGHGQGYADLHFIMPAVIRSVDVHKGPYSAAYGNFSTAGSIAFTTRDHLDHNLIRVEGGSFDTHGITALYEVPLGSTHQGAYLAGQFHNTDGPFESAQGFQRFNLFGKFHAHISESSRLGVSVSGFASAWDASGQIPERAVSGGVIDRFGSVDDLEGGATSRHDINLRYEASRESHRFLLQGFASSYSFKLFSNFTFFLDDADQGDMIEQTDQRNLVGLNGTYQFTSELFSGIATTSLGGCLRSDDVGVSLWKSPSRIRFASLVDSEIRERNMCLWIQEDLVPSSWFRLQLGMRADYFTFDVDDRLEVGPGALLPHASGFAQRSIVSPKASLVFTPISALDVFVNAGTSLHSNDARSIVIGERVADLVGVYRREGRSDEEINDLLAARHLDAAQMGVESLPRAVGFELGARSHVSRRLTVAAALWRLDLEREYVYVGDGGYTELSGQSRRHGVDIEARLGVTSWLSADVDLNLAKPTLVDEPDGANAIPLAPRRTSSGGLTILHPSGLEGSVRYVHVGSRPAIEDGSIMAEGFTMINLFGAYRIGPVRVDVAVENLLDIVWNEAQFATTSRLRTESLPVSELHFTPGNPRNVRLGLAYLF